jgi:VIT1/CCC1 family predicted Fe2+/Mn2+ transporter
MRRCAESAAKRAMPMPRRHRETHRTRRLGWLRAAVLGANDGIVATARLVLGVAAADLARGDVLLAGVSGLVAGAMSMAAGEYVSVRSQADTEKAELARERSELKANIATERRELAAIYVARGVEPDLAQKVADQLMAFDALGAHARDELGITEPLRARPVQAAAASAAAFAVGASVPLVVLALAPADAIGPYVAAACLFALASLGAVSARLGGASMTRAALRIAFWGATAMAVTSGIGWLVGMVPP